MTIIASWMMALYLGAQPASETRELIAIVEITAARDAEHRRGAVPDRRGALGRGQERRYSKTHCVN